MIRHIAVIVLVGLCTLAAISPAQARLRVAGQAIARLDRVTQPASGSVEPVRVHIMQSAVVTVPYAALVDAGWNMSAVDMTTLRVLRHGLELPVELTAAGVRFVATANEGQYSTTAVYWISAGGERGLRAALPSAPSQPLEWAPDRVYQPAAITWRGDRWFAAELRGITPTTANVTLPHELPAGSTIVLDVTALAASGNHRVAVALDDGEAGILTWSGGAEPHALALITAAPISAGKLSIDLRLASQSDEVVLLDGIRIPDARVALPALEVGSVERNDHMPPFDTDTLIVTHESLLSEIEALAEAHRALGQRVAVVDVQAAYNAFSFGERDPEAIRRLIRSSVQPPARVILVGAGSVRLRVEPDELDTNLIPPFLVDADPKYGEIACDTCYTRLDSENVLDDPIHDIAIGRLPAHTAQEARVLIEKTRRALLAPVMGAWTRRALLVADNDNESDGAPDPAGPFLSQLDQVEARLPAVFETERFLYAPERAQADDFFPEAGLLRRALLPAWSAGAALVVFAGHASPWQWGWTSAQDTTPYLFHLYDADSLANDGRLPILVSLTCQSGNLFNPTLAATDERLLLRSRAGIVAALSPVGSAVNTGHSALSAGLFPTLAAGGTLGAAHLAGLQQLLRERHDLDLAFGYHLLGDPDVRLPVRPGHEVFLPFVERYSEAHNI